MSLALICEEPVEYIFPYFVEEEEIFLEEEKHEEYVFTLPKNPTLACVLSAFIPGAGQIYNEKYLKAGGVIIVQSYLIGMTVYSDSKMKDYKDKRNNSEGYLKDFYNGRYHDYYEMRQSYIYWVGASVFVSAMEAFVDAHLLNFNYKKNEIRLKFEDQKLVISVAF